MTQHCCRCHCELTIDNIYPSDLKHKIWICKSCSNEKKRQSKNHNQLSTQLNITTRSTANHIRSQPTPTKQCSKCTAYNPTTSTCHYNPPNPYFPRVSPTDYCIKFTLDTSNQSPQHI